MTFVRAVFWNNAEASMRATEVSWPPFPLEIPVAASRTAVHLRLADLPQVMELIDLKPPLMHLILTGRDAHPRIVERADTVSEVREIKHAFRKDIEPQKGVDF